METKKTFSPSGPSMIKARVLTECRGAQEAPVREAAPPYLLAAWQMRHLRQETLLSSKEAQAKVKAQKVGASRLASN